MQLQFSDQQATSIKQCQSVIAKDRGHQSSAASNQQSKYIWNAKYFKLTN